MKALYFVLTVLAGLCATAPAHATAYTISVGDNFYSPTTLSIRVGDVVTWRYQGNSTHPTASTTGAWQTFTLTSITPTMTMTFNTAGTFDYYCMLHGSPGSGMAGSIRVDAALGTMPAQPAPDLLAYPNPATQLVRLAFAPLAAGGSLELLDARGAVVRRQAVAPASHEAQLPVAELPAGLYWCRLLAGTQVLATRALQVGLP